MQLLYTINIKKYYCLLSNFYNFNFIFKYKFGFHLIAYGSCYNIF